MMSKDKDCIRCGKKITGKTERIGTTNPITLPGTKDVLHRVICACGQQQMRRVQPRKAKKS